jgi:hypothetical protein
VTKLKILSWGIYAGLSKWPRYNFGVVIRESQVIEIREEKVEDKEAEWCGVGGGTNESIRTACRNRKQAGHRLSFGASGREPALQYQMSQ